MLFHAVLRSLHVTKVLRSLPVRKALRSLPVTVACLCVCDTLKTSREATNLILNQSVVEKPLPLLDSQQQDYISSFPEIFLLCSYHPLGLYNVKKKSLCPLPPSATSIAMEYNKVTCSHLSAGYQIMNVFAHCETTAK